MIFKLISSLLLAASAQSAEFKNAFSGFTQKPSTAANPAPAKAAPKLTPSSPQPVPPKPEPTAEEHAANANAAAAALTKAEKGEKTIIAEVTKFNINTNEESENVENCFTDLTALNLHSTPLVIKYSGKNVYTWDGQNILDSTSSRMWSQKDRNIYNGRPEQQQKLENLKKLLAATLFENVDNLVINSIEFNTALIEPLRRALISCKPLEIRSASGLTDGIGSVSEQKLNQLNKYFPPSKTQRRSKARSAT